MKYLAFDGSVFDNELDCRNYERENNSIEQKRVNERRETLMNWLKNNDLQIGFRSIADGDDEEDVFLYSTNNEEIESASLWDDD